jgi:Tfp pilus assembly protein PilN
MKAVNLIPAETRRGRGVQSSTPHGPAIVVVGLLVVALIFVTIAVLTNNTISARKAKLATLTQQVAQEQATAASLTNYAAFEQLAKTRVETVRQIASARFDWHAALSDLSKVVPANTSLQSLVGSVAPGANAGGGAAGGGGVASSLRGDLSVPAFEITGCTRTHDDVARLLSRLRVINGVTRVTLGDSQKVSSAQSGTAVSSGGGGCGANAPNFDLVVFFKPLPGAGPTGVTAASALPVTATSTTPGGSK